MVERVSEPLTKFLFDSLKNKRVIDESFIAEVIEIVVNALGLNEYVKGYKINNKPWDGSDKIKAAKYNYSSKKITFYLQTALEFYRYNSNKFRLDTWEKIAFIYDRVMQTLLHELEHANQPQKIDFESKDLEKVILGYTNIPILLYEHFYKLIEQGYSGQKANELISEKNYISRKYYEYNTKERLAEYYSHKTMATILKELGTLPNISYFECLKLCQNYIKGYIEGIVPTKFYFEVLGFSDFWPRIEAASQNLDFESRASLGLPISEKEYKYLEDTTATLERLIIK